MTSLLVTGALTLVQASHKSESKSESKSSTESDAKEDNQHQPQPQPQPQQEQQLVSITTAPPPAAAVDSAVTTITEVMGVDTRLVPGPGSGSGSGSVTTARETSAVTGLLSSSLARPCPPDQKEMCLSPPQAQAQSQSAEQSLPPAPSCSRPTAQLWLKPLPQPSSPLQSQQKKKLKPKPKILQLPLRRGDGVLFRYKKDSTYFIGLGVVERMCLPRSTVHILPFKHFVEKEDQYKNHKHNNYKHNSSNYNNQQGGYDGPLRGGGQHAEIQQQGVGRSMHCLYKKWKVSGANIMEVALDAIMSNQIKFKPKGSKLTVYHVLLNSHHQV